MKRKATELEETDLTKIDDDAMDDDNNPELSKELVLVTNEQRITKKPKIINEPVVDQDVMNDMEKLVSEGDMRGMLGIKNGKEFEVKWTVEYDDGVEEYKWYKAKVVQAETGQTHRFRPEPDSESESDDDEESEEELSGEESEEEMVDAPVVKIKSLDDNEVHEVVFLTPHEIFHIEYNYIMAWREVGDDWDESDDESSDVEVHFEYENDTELKDLAGKLVSEMFVNTLEKFRDRYEKLSVIARNNLGCEILRFKQVLTDKIVSYFKSNEKQGYRVTMPKDAIEPLFDDALKEMENN